MSSEPTPTPATLLLPRLSMPIAAFFAGFVVGWPAFAIVRFGLGRDLWWVTAVLGTQAAALLFISANLFVARRKTTIVISDDYLFTNGAHISRDQVLRVARYADLMFKGVQIDLANGRRLRVPVHFHRPGRLIAAFKQHGYRIGGPA